MSEWSWFTAYSVRLADGCHSTMPMHCPACGLDLPDCHVGIERRLGQGLESLPSRSGTRRAVPLVSHTNEYDGRRPGEAIQVNVR
jgi:hypothetical protein